MTGQPTITDTHTWDGTHHLPDWLHWDGHHLTLPGRDDTTPPQPGWMLVRWSDGQVTVASPQVAARVYGPDGMRGRLERAEAELADRDAAESADAAAGSYAGRAETAEQQRDQLAALVRDFLDPDPCQLDHHGYCQAHLWMCSGSTCPHARAREALAALDDEPATEATGIETTARVLAALHRSAEDTVTRVIDLHERWSLAGPPLGKSMTGYFEWWRSHLAELHDAIQPPAEQPARTTATSPATGSALAEQLRAAIEHEVYEYRERTMLWGETEGVTEEIARLATRGALGILQANPAPIRDLIDTALRTTPRADCTDWPPREPHGQGHRYDMRCALCAGEADTLTDAVLAALQPQPGPGQPKEQP